MYWIIPVDQTPPRLFYFYSTSLSWMPPADQTSPYLFFLLCQLGLEAVSVGHGPLQTHVLVRDGGLQLVLLLCLLLDAVLQHLHLLHQLLQLPHLGLQLPLSRLLTEGQSGVNSVNDHTHLWNESALWKLKVWSANHWWSIVCFVWTDCLIR